MSELRRLLVLAPLLGACAVDTAPDAVLDAQWQVDGHALGAAGDYVVVMRPGMNPQGVISAAAVGPQVMKHRYGHAVRGFAAHLSRAQLAALSRHPDVALIEPDLRVFAVDEVQPGLERIGVLSNAHAKVDGIDERVDVDIAIIDTGIDLDHPDLNVVFDRNFVNRNDDGDDDHSHGTLVAGIAAALDDGAGVVGVAPGARLWALKALDSDGDGSTSDVIAAIDFVTQHAAQIEVVNMSLGGWGSSSAERLAIQASVAAGVVYVVAAGNEAADIFGPDGRPGVFPDFVPAAFAEVMTVSATVETDGAPGGAGPRAFYGADDTLAALSNFSASNRPDNPVISSGGKIDVAAPGTDITSTVPGGGLGISSGTSMASPHVAGAVALYVASHGRAHDASGVYAIRQAMVDAAEAQSAWRAGSTADRDSNPEPLVRVDRFVGSVTLFSDTFSNGLGAWTETGDGDWNTEGLHTGASYPLEASRAPAAHSDACTGGCTLELATPLDLRGFTRVTLSLLRFVDAALDAGEFLRVEASSGSSWTTIASWGGGNGDDDVWHREVFDLSSFAGSASFGVRLVTMQNRTDEHVHVDDVLITASGDGSPSGFETFYFDSFSAGLGGWIETGEGDWNTEALHVSTDYPSTASGAPAAHSDACVAGCTLTLATALDLSSCDAVSLHLLRFADESLDGHEYLRVDVWSGSAWVSVGIWQGGSGDDDRWHAERIDVTAHAIHPAFRVRLVTVQNRTDEHVHVDDLRILAAGCGQ